MGSLRRVISSPVCQPNRLYTHPRLKFAEYLRLHFEISSLWFSIAAGFIVIPPIDVIENYSCDSEEVEHSCLQIHSLLNASRLLSDSSERRTRGEDQEKCTLCK